MTYLGFALFALLVVGIYHFVLHRSVRNDLTDVKHAVETFESRWTTHHAATAPAAPAPQVVVVPVSQPVPTILNENPFHLPPSYLAAERAAPENLDRPDAKTLAYLLSITPSECVKVASAAPTGHPARAALERAARILDGAGRYIQIESGNQDAATAALNGTDPIFARWAAVMLAGVGNHFWGDAATQVQAPKPDDAPSAPATP